MINLFGNLARQFEKKFKTSPRNIPIRADSAWKAIRMLDANFPGFTKLLKRSGYYRVWNDKTTISTEELNLQFSSKDWNLMPIAAGCKSGFQAYLPIIIGAVLIGAAIFTGGLTAPALAAYTGISVSMGTIAAVSGAMMSFGVGILLAGLAGLFFGPEVAKQNKGFSDDRKSFLYRGPTNSVETGVSIPLVYGRTYVGSIVASGGISTADYKP